METLRSLYDKFNRLIFLRIESQFGNLLIEDINPNEMSDSEIFRRATGGRGKGKPHALKHYPKNEGKIKFS